MVTEVRRFRADQGLRPGQRVAGELTGLDRTGLEAHEGEIRALARLDVPGPGFASSATLRVGEITVAVDLSGAIDVTAERRRLEKERSAVEKERAQATAKLANEQFLAKAPDAVVEKIRGRLAKAEADLTRIEAQLASLPG
jgi:valyl-tRNA synthetase